MSNLPHHLERTVLIQASPETVFRFFTDNDRWARWWGAGSTIDPKPGGAVRIIQPGGVETLGTVVDINPPGRLVFTYGYASGNPIPPGASKVTITLTPEQAATRLTLRHDFPDPTSCEIHVQGWRFQLSLFANVVSDEVFAGAETAVDAWFDAWTIPDEQERLAAFMAIAVPNVVFRDRYSMLEGILEVCAHAGAAQRFMPGLRLKREGAVQHCQGMILAKWSAVGPDGKPLITGANVFQFQPPGLFNSVTGLAGSSA